MLFLFFARSNRKFGHHPSRRFGSSIHNVCMYTSEWAGKCLRVTHKNGLQDISALLPKVIGSIDFPLVNLPGPSRSSFATFFFLFLLDSLTSSIFHKDYCNVQHLVFPHPPLKKGINVPCHHRSRSVWITPRGLRVCTQKTHPCKVTCSISWKKFTTYGIWDEKYLRVHKQFQL